jgi:hypothetical protein
MGQIFQSGEAPPHSKALRARLPRKMYIRFAKALESASGFPQELKITFRRHIFAFK